MKALASYVQTHYKVNTPGEIFWSHAVNSKASLQRFLADPQFIMIESGTWFSRDERIIAAYPPAIDRDLSFPELTQAVSRTIKGLRLDLKDPETLIPCIHADPAYATYDPIDYE